MLRPFWESGQSSCVLRPCLPLELGFTCPWGWQWLLTVSILVCHPGMGSGGPSVPQPRAVGGGGTAASKGPLTLLGPQKAGISQGTSPTAAPCTCPTCLRSRLSHCRTCPMGWALLPRAATGEAEARAWVWPSGAHTPRAYCQCGDCSWHGGTGFCIWQMVQYLPSVGSKYLPSSLFSWSEQTLGGMGGGRRDAGSGPLPLRAWCLRRAGGGSGN